MKRLLIVLVIAVFNVVLVGTAMAYPTPIPDNLAIDFRTWTGASGQAFYSGTANVTATALPSTSVLWQDTTDGLGVQGGEADEIDNLSGQYEQLQVDITGGMNLTGVWLTDLFLSSASGNSPSENYAAPSPTGEPGMVVINGGNYTFTFVGVESNIGANAYPNNGELFVSFNQPITVYTAVFSVLPANTGNYAGIEYSVAGFEAAPVPIPAAAWLLGSGLLGLVAVRRRFRK